MEDVTRALRDPMNGDRALITPQPEVLASVRAEHASARRALTIAHRFAVGRAASNTSTRPDRSVATPIRSRLCCFHACHTDIRSCSPRGRRRNDWCRVHHPHRSERGDAAGPSRECRARSDTERGACGVRGAGRFSRAGNFGVVRFVSGAGDERLRHLRTVCGQEVRRPLHDLSAQIDELPRDGARQDVSPRCSM